MTTVLLITLLVLFIARVLGQIVALTLKPRWLPPMKEWYSGLLSYPILLPAQIAIIALMVMMIRDVAASPGQDRPLALGIAIFATIYALVMLVRALILRRKHPDYRWYQGGMIPIMFHWVLAAFLFTYASARM
jgi:hypothetical protein